MSRPVGRIRIMKIIRELKQLLKISPYKFLYEEEPFI